MISCIFARFVEYPVIYVHHVSLWFEEHFPECAHSYLIFQFSCFEFLQRLCFTILFRYLK